MAHAIGDSGGCPEFNSTPLGKALREGTPQDVEREIRNWVAKFAPRSFLAKSRDRETLNLIQGTHDKDAVCAPGALLPVALDAGNVDVTRFLLSKPLGLDPRIPPNILFFTCDYHGSMSPAQRDARRRALGILLDTKAVDVNALRDGRYPLLWLCKQPELVSLYLERGARVDVEVAGGLNLLEAAIMDGLTTDEDGATAKSLHAVERAKLFSRALTDSIAGRPIESRVRAACTPGSRSKLSKPRTCRELSTFIKASPGVFGESR